MSRDAEKRTLENYEEACQSLANTFVEKYYKGTSVESWWVASLPGGTLYVNDAFWDPHTMAEAIRINAPVKKLHEWYWTASEKDGTRPMNLTSFCKLKK